MHRGYIKLWRKIQDWEWYDNLMIVGFFQHLILEANYKDSKYHGYDVPRGSLVFGRKESSKRFGVGEQVIRTMLTRLKSTNEITIKVTNKFSIISIVSFEKYQDNSTNKTTTDLTSIQPATNQQLTTSKECKEGKKEKNKAFVVPTDEDFIKSLHEGEAYKHINISSELSKMDKWIFDHPGRKKTRRFILRWLNKIEAPVLVTTNTRSDPWKNAQVI